jgi:hypothetical protein
MTTSKELTQNVGRHFHALSALEHQCSQRVIRSSLLKERGKIRLRQRIRSRALTSRTFLTVWSFVLPLSLAFCAAGSWGRTIRRSVPSWAQGGRLAGRRVQGPPPARRPGERSRLPRHQAAGRGLSGSGRGHHREAATLAAAPGAGRASTDGLCSGPCRTGVLGRLAARRFSHKRAESRDGPRVSAAGRVCRRPTGAPSAASHRGAPSP